MIQCVDGSVLLQLLCSAQLVFMESSLEPPHKDPELSELVKERLVGKERNVLGVVVGLVSCTAFVHLLGILWLVWVDSFQNAQTSKVKVHAQLNYSYHKKLKRWLNWDFVLLTYHNKCHPVFSEVSFSGLHANAVLECYLGHAPETSHQYHLLSK